jgi:hypothetical protein
MRRIIYWSAGLAALFIVHPVEAQERPPEPATSTVAPPAPADPPANAPPPDAEAARLARLAQAMSPAEYGRAFYAGAQAELVVPDIGISALLLGYDAIWTQVELSLGLGVGEDPVMAVDEADNYIATLRVAFPIHRGIRSDFALLFGGGVTFIDPPETDTFALGTFGAGAKFRAFFTPNVAVGAALGIVAFIRGEHSNVVMGARPLGAASVVYFFR